MTIKKLLRMDDVVKRKQDARINPGGGSVQLGKPSMMTPGQFLDKFGTELEKAEMMRAIEERRGRLPRFIYKICPGCNWKMKTLFGDNDIRVKGRPDYCLSCNRAGFTDGAIMREMTPKEAETFESDTRARETRAIERTKTAHFHESNQSRLAAGLSAQTRGEFDEDSRRAARQIIERSQAR